MSDLEWRLLKTDYSSGAVNMALDEAIMESVRNGETPPTIRFYGWQPPAVSLGYFQSLEEEIDATTCQKLGIDIVRRLTGGRAVLHDDELTYSLITSEESSFLPDSVIESYKIISQGLLVGLKELGIEAELVSLADKEEKKRGESAACFDAPSWYELTVDNKKIVGSAQTRREGVILQHGSILNTQDLEQLFSILKFRSERHKERFKKIFINKATTIKEAIGNRFSLDKLAAAFKRGMEKGLNITLKPGELTSRELKRTEELAEEKYSSREWNYKR